VDRRTTRRLPDRPAACIRNGSFPCALGPFCRCFRNVNGVEGGRDGGGRVPSSCAPGEIPEFPVLASEGVISLLATVTVATCAHANVL
jgi:hypothetical protein